LIETRGQIALIRGGAKRGGAGSGLRRRRIGLPRTHSGTERAGGPQAVVVVGLVKFRGDRGSGVWPRINGFNELDKANSAA